jgi:hypothetical protein
MGILGDIGKVIVGGVLGGPGGAIAVFTAQHGEEVLEGTIDVARQIVRIGTDVYRAVPPEVFALGGDPIHGLLKHEAEDELVLLGQIAGDAIVFAGLTWPAVGPFGAAGHLYVTGRLLLGKVHHRRPNAQEWEMAQHIFRDSLPDRRDVILTNLGGLDGRPFTYPLAPLCRPIMVNLAGAYDPDSTVADGPLLFHELTHVWQAEQRLLREIFFYDARVLLTEGRSAYYFEPGQQWDDYNIEQQASIVEAWTRGATRRAENLPTGSDRFDDGARRPFAIASPVFRYLNGNVRRSRRTARTDSGRSVRRLLREGGHSTMAEMQTEPPTPWW